MNYIDIINDYYKCNTRLNFNSITFFDTFTITNPNAGIGDSLSVYLLDKPIIGKNISVIINHPKLVHDLNQFNKFIPSINKKYNKFHTLFSTWDIQLHSKFGGHFFQQIQHFLGLPIDIKPKAKLTSGIPVIKNKVVMTFDKGIVNQQHIHPRARMIYEESKNIIQQFINTYKNTYTFIEVGKYSLNLDNVENKTNIGIEKTAEEIASCDYFFGNHNGLMHIAAAFEKKSIIIINFPDAKDIILPRLSKNNIVDIDWLYPQNIHLHQDNEGLLVPKLTYNNIIKAFNGEIYPFFNDKYLHNTFDRLVNYG